MRGGPTLARIEQVAGGIREIRRFEGPSGKHVIGVAISPDGRQVLTATTIAGPGWRRDSSNSLRLYEFSTGKQVGTFAGSARVFSVAISSDGKTAISGGD